MFKLPVISQDVIRFMYRAIRETTVLAVIMHPIEIMSSTFQTKTNQMFKRLIGLDIPDETRFEPTIWKQFIPTELGQNVM